MEKQKRPRSRKNFETLTREEIIGTENAADAALKEVLGKLYDPNWRDRPPTASSLPADFDHEEFRRQTTIAFLPTPYRLEKSDNPTRHRMGGRMRSNFPKCGICRSPLVLFANLDATDPRLRGEHPLRRIPLYYCCSCPGPVCYRALPNGGTKVVPSKPDPYDECPFGDWPQVLPSGYLELHQVPARCCRDDGRLDPPGGGAKQ